MKQKKTNFLISYFFRNGKILKYRKFCYYKKLFELLYWLCQVTPFPSTKVKVFGKLIWSSTALSHYVITYGLCVSYVFQHLFDCIIRKTLNNQLIIVKKYIWTNHHTMSSAIWQIMNEFLVFCKTTLRYEKRVKYLQTCQDWS